MKLKGFANRIEEYISSVLLAIMLVILSMQVFLRLFASSNSWSEEVARYMFIWIIFLGAGMAAQTCSHICISILLKLWPKILRPYVQIIGSIVWIVFCCIIVYYSGSFAYRLYITGTISLGLHINMAIPYAGVTVGYFFTAVRVLQNQLIPQVKDLLHKPQSERKGVEL